MVSSSAWAVAGCFFLFPPGCDSRDDIQPVSERGQQSIVNFEHLDHLGEIVGPDRQARIIHIYSEAPSYDWVGDSDEGIAAVDDAARAAVVYLRAFELSQSAETREKAEGLIRFILYMQTETGLFYNFVLDNELEINKTHPNSTADALNWWACRAAWALGVAADVLKEANPEMSQMSASAVGRMLPHIDELLSRYGQTRDVVGRRVPLWLVHETAADATSELLMGLWSLDRAYPDETLRRVIDRLAEGIAMMQWGDMATFPYAAHGSWIDGWHGWGNSQTQSLSQIGMTDSAVREARHFYSRLLVEGWLHSFEFNQPGVLREFEQIAYAVRCVSVGLIRLYEASGDDDYLVMAGLAASWLTGNNVSGRPMYDPDTGRGYDGIGSSTGVNVNAGAESTIEALYTILEVERYEIASHWLFARGRKTKSETIGGKEYVHRLFATEHDSVALVMNLTDKRLDLVPGAEFSTFLGR